MDKSTMVVALGVSGLLWVAASAQQEMLPKPGPGSGITNVTGSVNVANTPHVRSMQEGEWKVAVANAPTVRVTEVPAAAFLRTSTRYQITWSDGLQETVTVISAASNGWLEVERGRRWINPNVARSITEAK